MPETLVFAAWLGGMRLFGPLDTEGIILEQKYAMVRAKFYYGGHSGSGPPHRPSPSPGSLFWLPSPWQRLGSFPGVLRCLGRNRPSRLAIGLMGTCADFWWVIL